MRRLVMACLVLAAGCAAADEPPQSAAARKLAEGLAVAMSRGDYAQVIDHTYEGIVQELGGRDPAIKVIEASMEQMTEGGFRLRSFDVGDPRDVLTEGDNTFVVIPTSMQMDGPTGRVVGEGYLLGISSDAGKTWKFADGYGLTEEIRERVLPKLPAGLTLPQVRVVKK